MKAGYWLLLILVLPFALACLVGCSPVSPVTRSSPGPDLKEKAAAEATAMIQSAEATVLVMQAQAQATALLQGASGAGPATAPAVQTPAQAAGPSLPLNPTEQQVASVASPSPPGVSEPVSTAPADPAAVELVGVSIGAETGLILVQFRAPRRVADKWRQGMVYVVDEATEAVYNGIPVLPIVGPLFARPQNAGQIGYVMFANTAPGLRQGAMVTVVLGEFKQEHVVVK